MVGKTFIVRYPNGSNRLTVRGVFEYTRADVPTPIMSSSSGPKDYIRNQVWQRFQDDPELSSVLIVRAAGGAPFALFGRGKQYFDAAGQSATVEAVK